MPNKRPANDVIELGNSWKSDGDSNPGLVDYGITTGFTMIIIIFSCYIHVHCSCSIHYYVKIQHNYPSLNIIKSE